MMIFRGLKLRAITAKGDFGFDVIFGRNLNIVKGGNSSGKSTLVNTLLYCFGMEELIGGKGIRTLPYAVKDYVEYDGGKVQIISSEVLLEIENKDGDVVTLRRAIKDQVRDSKLIEIFPCSHLIKNEELNNASATYIHDAGGAKYKEGYHYFLEKFIGFSLPEVSTTGGGESKLYIQTIFSALLVEQKRGWTDYIANIPFYGIRDVKIRVVEFLLGLDVFKTSSIRNRLNAEFSEISSEWRKITDELNWDASKLGFFLDGLHRTPSGLFSADSVLIKRVIGNSNITIDEYMVQLRDEYTRLSNYIQGGNTESGKELLNEINKVSEELQDFSVLYERTKTSINTNRASLREYERLLSETVEDLERNKAAAKLKALGAQHGLKVARDHCPTCNQEIEDNLLTSIISGPQMDLATNINYLDSQGRMLKRQIDGIKDIIRNLEGRYKELSSKISEKYEYLHALRNDVRTGDSDAKAAIRRQVQIEVEVESIDKYKLKATSLLTKLEVILGEFIVNENARKNLPKSSYSLEDEKRIRIFERLFRENAGSFGYESAPIEDIELSRDNLVPCLSQLELREIRRSDIKADSSASDFVRLIWSYLLALYQTSNVSYVLGNHPGVLMFDEPGQHSMAVSSQHALLQKLASLSNLQSIIAASFDESEAIFNEATINVSFNLIEWDGKLIGPIGSHA
ncbi:TPA: hypothetical protein LSH72_000896 [Klebsiella oxytoca]|nr:hypothetical protein [Klebsiella oxytoca]HBL6908727.1 hypothetical protein [Klebsiella oxytoca]